MDKDKEENELECVTCFLVEVILTPTETQHEIVHRCEFCKRYEPTGEDLLVRILKIMDRTRAKNMPQILRLMHAVYSEKFTSCQNHRPEKSEED